MGKGNYVDAGAEIRVSNTPTLIAVNDQCASGGLRPLAHFQKRLREDTYRVNVYIEAVKAQWPP